MLTRLGKGYISLGFIYLFLNCFLSYPSASRHCKGRIQDAADLHSVGRRNAYSVETRVTHSWPQKLPFQTSVLQLPDPEASTWEKVLSSRGTVAGNATAGLKISEHYISANSRLEEPAVRYPQCLSLLMSAIQARAGFSDSEVISPTTKVV